MRQTTRAALVVASALVLTACGSAVPPEEFVNAQGVGAQVRPSDVNQAGGGGASAQQQSTAPTAIASDSTLGNQNGGGSGGGGSGGGSGGVGGGGGGSGGSRSGLGVAAASCDGFKNGPGITDSTITVANASDVSGPVPGLFKSAQQATQAFAAYFNSTSSICKRKLSVVNLDSQTSSLGDQQAALEACGRAFAMVGSMSAYDDGGAGQVQKCGIPDLRAIMVNAPRARTTVSYAVDAISISQIPTSPYDYFKSVGGDAYKHAAMLYLNGGAAIPNAKSFEAAETKMGYHFVYTQAIDVTAFNYAPYVSEMQQKGVKYVQWLGSFQHGIRLKRAMVQQGFKPMFVMDSVAYDAQFAQSGGSDVDGTWAFVDTALNEEISRNPELQLYAKWLNRVAPGSKPTFFGTFAWGAAKLFTEKALALGGRLNRSTLLAAIRATHGYTGNGLFAPQDVGGRHTTPCQAVIQLVNGKWVRKYGNPYKCGSLVDSGVNG